MTFVEYRVCGEKDLTASTFAITYTGFPQVQTDDSWLKKTFSNSPAP